jgi:hypothetical protein
MAQSTQSITGSNGQDLTFRFSEISNLLKGRLTDAELNDLLIGLLSASTMDVSPGDLITADWAMGVIHRLERLELGNIQTNPINTTALACFLDTSNFYEGLVLQGTFVPPDGSTVPIKAVLQVTAALQRVSMTGLIGVAIVQSADTTGLLKVFQRLYDTQSDLVALLSSQTLGSGDVGQKTLFCQLMKIQLDQDQANGVLSFHSALNQANLGAAISAQNRINGIVMNHSGDVTLGNLQVVYQGSDNGETLVLNDRSPYRYFFRVFNKTNKTLDAQVSAAFRGSPAAWSNSIKITGSPQLTGLSPFNPSSPSDSKAYRDIEVVVTTPSTGIQLTEIVFLDLKAEIAAPNSPSDTGSVQLTVGSQKTPPQLNWIRFSAPPAVIAGNPKGAVQLEPVTYRFSYLFHSSTSPNTPRKFLVKVSVTSLATEANLFAINFSAGIIVPTPPTKDTANSTSILCQSTLFSVNSDEPGDFQIDVRCKPTASGKTLTFLVVMQSEDLALTTATPPTISITAA